VNIIGDRAGILPLARPGQNGGTSGKEARSDLFSPIEAMAAPKPR
jgi:hypothetical protein